MDNNTLAKAWELKQSLIPTDNTFNVVSIDEHELPEDALYMVGNYDSEEEANKKKSEQEGKGIRTFVYSKDTK